MGRQYGGVHISGKIGDVQYYLDGTQGYAKKSNPVSRDRIMKSSKFLNLRKSMAEFKASSLAADSLQAAFEINWQAFGERFLRSRLAGLTREIVKHGSGPKGRRRFEVGPNLEAFEKFDLNENHKLAQNLRADYDVTVNADRNTATLVVAPFDSKKQTSGPLNATHFRMFLSVGVLTDFVWVGGKVGYKSSQPNYLGLKATQYTVPMVCDGSMNPGFQLVTSLANSPVLPSDACLVACIGIEYLEMVNGFEDYFREGMSMQIFKAF